MNVQSKKFELGDKYFSEIKAKNFFFTNYNDNSNIDYEHFLVPLRCALYVLEEKDEKKNDKKETDKKEEKEKNVIKKRITFSKNNINNISSKKEKIEILNNYDKKEKDESNNLENDELKIGYIIKKYNKFIDMILFIVEKNSEVLNNEKIHLLNLFNKTDKEKYFKMLCTKENDYIYWKQFGLEPPMIKISKLLDGKINIINKNPYTIYFEKCK
jgi:hypothetical protein